MKAAPAVKAKGSGQKASSPGLAERTEGMGEGTDIPFLSVSVAWTSRISPDPPRTSGPSSPCKDNSTGGCEAARGPEKSVYEVTGREERTQVLPHTGPRSPFLCTLPARERCGRAAVVRASTQLMLLSREAQSRTHLGGGAGSRGPRAAQIPRVPGLPAEDKTRSGGHSAIPSPTHGSQSRGRKFLQARNGGPCGEAGRAASSLSQDNCGQQDYV